jgi:hypothetical protein
LIFRAARALARGRDDRAFGPAEFCFDRLGSRSLLLGFFILPI